MTIAYFEGATFLFCLAEKQWFCSDHAPSPISKSGSAVLKTLQFFHAG